MLMAAAAAASAVAPAVAASSVIRIALCSYFTNAGGTTRAVEIAGAIRDGGRVSNTIIRSNSANSNNSIGEEFEIDLRVFSYRSRPPGRVTGEDEGEGGGGYERLVRDAGFEVEHFGPPEVYVDDEMFAAFLRAERSGQGAFFPSPYEERAPEYIRAVVDTLRHFEPTIVVHGLFPEVSVATKILGLPSVSYGPLPMDPAWLMPKRQLYGTEKDADADGAAAAAKGRKGGAAFVPPPQPTPPSAEQSTLYRAAVECGWNPPPDAAGGVALLDLMTADECLVCDLPSNYVDDADSLGPHTHVTGPIFARCSSAASPSREGGDKDGGSSEEDLPPRVRSALLRPRRRGRYRAYLTMASSGEKSLLLEAVRALCDLCRDGVHDGDGSGDGTPLLDAAIISVPSIACTLSEVERFCRGRGVGRGGRGDGAGLPDGVVLADEFLPSHRIASLVDAVVCHGGQGTVQSAMAAGTPIVGVGLQWEQRYNLDNYATRRGAGIRLTRAEWTAENIREAVGGVLRDRTYREAARGVRDEMVGADGGEGLGRGAKNAGEKIFEFASAAAVAATAVPARDSK